MTALKAYRIEGNFPMGINRKQKFVKEMACKDEAEAKEMLYSLLGSEHGVKRRMIKIAKIEIVNPEDVTSPQVRHMLGVK